MTHAQQEHQRGLSRQTQHYAANYSITTSVTIRVTPHEDYLVSWGILWGLFVATSIIGGFQIWKEHLVIAARRQVDDAEPGSSPGGAIGGAATSDGEGVSSADVTRGLFRRQLVLAMLTRVVVIPIQIWSDPIWWQFVGDSLPALLYASAWTTLVTFMSQVDGICTGGTATSTTPGIVIQATAVMVYIVLIITQVWNQIATVLLYALMCCIYAALFGTVSYYCPRVLLLMRPSLVRRGGVTIRLAICAFVCMTVFLAHTIGYARLVISPPKDVYWWWKYGALELLPSVLFLFMMGPVSHKTGRGDSPIHDDDDENEGEATSTKKPTIRRSDSASSANSGGHRRGHETTTFLAKSLPSVPSYGSNM